MFFQATDTDVCIRLPLGAIASTAMDQVNFCRLVRAYEIARHLRRQKTVILCDKQSNRWLVSVQFNSGWFLGWQTL